MQVQGINWASYLAEGAPPAPAEIEAPLRQARTLLAAEEVKTEEIASLPAPLQLALIEQAVREGRVALVQAAEQVPERSVAKAARRALHHLRSRRVKVSSTQKAPEKSPLRFSEEALPSYSSFLDSRGDRMVLLLRRVPQEGYYLFQVFLAEEEGIKRFDFPGCLPRGQARRFIEETRRQIPFPFVALPAPYIRALIEEGIQKSARLSRLPEEAAEAAPHLGPSTERLHPHPVYSLLRPPARPARPPERLFSEPSLESFLPPQEDIMQLEQALAEVETSQLYVDDAQRARGREDAIERIALRAFQSEDTRNKIRRRLEETAFLLFYDQKTELAEDVLYYAQSVGSSEEKKYAPFALAFYRRVFQFPALTEVPGGEPRGSSGGLILP